jgi:phosphoadenosine phosphosulfate reductase
LAALNAAFEDASAEEILAWVDHRFGRGAVLTSSFQDAVLVDLAYRTAPEIEVVLLDTQYLFAETLWYVEELRERYPMSIDIVRPRDRVKPDNLWQTDLDGCCAVRKVEPLRRALAGRAAWVTGVRRADAPSRAGTAVVAWDEGRRLVKVNPIAAWSDDDVTAYQDRHGLPRHPLADKGYPSIGCWPCTRPVAAGGDSRAGRWAGAAKTECGLHT